MIWRSLLETGDWPWLGTLIAFVSTIALKMIFRTHFPILLCVVLGLSFTGVVAVTESFIGAFSAGQISSPGDLRYIGIPFFMAIVPGLPGALFAAAILQGIARHRRGSR